MPGGAGGAPRFPKEPKMMRVGNAPVSWGVYEADRPNPPFSDVLDGIARAHSGILLEPGTRNRNLEPGTRNLEPC